MSNAAPGAPHGEVFARIKNGLNVKVADLAPLIGITEAGLYRAVREKRIEAINIGRAVFIPARVAAPLVGIKPDTAAQIAA
ncbi:hypothetical protein [Methylorubrum aminovorans]|uniref:hypothetical protein n=1 Tax=Methylorubrum aminovorans TaxID=269069 RepID=UPI003C30475F